MDIKIPHLQIAHQGGNLEVENIKIHRMINFKIVNGRLIDQAENSLLHTRLAEEELKCRKLTIYSVRFKAFHFFLQPDHLEHLTYLRETLQSTFVNSFDPNCKIIYHMLSSAKYEFL